MVLLCFGYQLSQVLHPIEKSFLAAEGLQSRVLRILPGIVDQEALHVNPMLSKAS